jgi:type IV secretion system protein TrbD
MALRTIPLRKVNRDNLWLGGDRELVMFCGLMAFSLVFSAQEIRASIIGVALWVTSLFLLRLVAKSDPQMRMVYLRSLRYKRYYPANSTPFRENTKAYK